MQRADHLDFNRRRLAEQCLNLRAIFADNVREISARVGEVFGFEIDFVGKDVAVHRAERAERIRGVEHLVGCIVGHHRFRPMHHRRHYECERMPAGRERVHFLNEQRTAVHVEREELVNHLQCLRIADDLDLGMAQYQFLHRAAVVGLHMIDNQIIERSSIQRVLEVFKENITDAAIHRVQQHGLFIQQQIRVVRNTARDRVNIFKQRKSPVASANPDHIRRNLLYTIHVIRPPYSKRCRASLHFQV